MEGKTLAQVFAEEAARKGVPGSVLVAGTMPGRPLVDVQEYLPRVLPHGWEMQERRADGAAYREVRLGIVVIVSAALEDDGRRWLHVSFSRARKMPSWEEQAQVKALFVGPDRYAYSVLPPADKHVNLHPYCLHLWCPLDGPVLPDFTRGSGGI